MTRSRAKPRRPITVGSEVVQPGERQRLEIPVSRLPTGTWLELPVDVAHGRHDGPVVWLCAAIHGDELNGVEVIRRVMRDLRPKTLRGTVIAVPVVNVFGFINESRYLPDRRDLNRAFPGSRRGSLAGRLAHLFMSAVVAQSDYGIDLHTGSDHRTNVSHIRGDLSDPETRRIAEAFGGRFLVNARVRDGSLREAAREQGVPVLVFEGGQPHRFEPDVIEAGVRGVRNVLSCLGMGPNRAPRGEPPIELASSRWLRARRGGLFRPEVGLGEHVSEKQVVGRVSDALARQSLAVKAPQAGWVIGLNLNPIVHQGDALVHVGLPATGASPPAEPAGDAEDDDMT